MSFASSRIALVLSLSFVALASASACGGKEPAPASPENAAPESGAVGASSAADGSGAADAAAPAPGVLWKDMKREERIAYMKSTVLPKMKATFQAFDAKEFANVTCVTCHGEDAKKGEFEMPNPDLPKLSVEGGFKKHMDKEPAITKFMMNEVVPQMAALLGEKPYDPATHKGFGCFDCHTQAK